MAAGMGVAMAPEPLDSTGRHTAGQARGGPARVRSRCLTDVRQHPPETGMAIAVPTFR